MTSDEVKSDKTATTHLFAFDSSLVSLLQIGWFAVTVGAERNVVESCEEDVFEAAWLRLTATKQVRFSSRQKCRMISFLNTKSAQQIRTVSPTEDDFEAA